MLFIQLFFFLNALRLRERKSVGTSGVARAVSASGHMPAAVTCYRAIMQI